MHAHFDSDDNWKGRKIPFLTLLDESLPRFIRFSCEHQILQGHFSVGGSSYDILPAQMSSNGGDDTETLLAAVSAFHIRHLTNTIDNWCLPNRIHYENI